MLDGPSLLDKVVAGKKASLRTPKKPAKKASADPNADVDGVESCLRDFMQRRKSTHLWMCEEFEALAVSCEQGHF